MSNSPFSISTLYALAKSMLANLDGRKLNSFIGRLLELHAEGKLGNNCLAKLSRKPIFCIEQIVLLNEERIEASFRFPANKADWAFSANETLDMLFQDQLDQWVGLWAQFGNWYENH